MKTRSEGFNFLAPLTLSLISGLCLCSGVSGQAAVPGPPFFDGGLSVAQQAFLKASNTESDDFFGRAVAMSADTLVVGAANEASNATGVGGDQSDNSTAGAGAVFVFVRENGSWSQQAYLKASNTEPANGGLFPGDNFGHSVAISGDTIVVGAIREGSNATGVNGDESDNSLFQAGAAYVFVRNGTTWSQQAYLKASNTAATDFFGYSVALSGDTALVSALQEDSAATGINGDENDDGAGNAGAVYVFVRSGTSWSQQAYLKASNTAGSDFFGESVALSGDTALIGASGEDSADSGVNGNETDDGASRSGAAYVFVRSGTTWSQQAYLKASNTATNDFFGQSVALSGDTALVGAWGEDSADTGVNGNDSDNGAARSGAAYVFARNGTIWTQQAYLKASNTGADDRFGSQVALSGDAAVVGARFEGGSATGVDGDGSDNSADNAGAAYLFVRDGTTWSHRAYLKASNTGAFDEFSAVSLANTTVIVGASREDGSATGVNGNQNVHFQGAFDSGATYVYEIGAWQDLGLGLDGIGVTDPFLAGIGPLTAGTPVSLDLSSTLDNAPAFLFVGSVRLDFSPFFGGTLVPDFLAPGGSLHVLVTDGAGAITLNSTWPAAIPSGFEFYLQYWIEDASAPFGFAASNAIRGTSL